MKKLAVISFTERGSMLNSHLIELLSSDYLCEGWCVERYAEKYSLNPLDERLQDWTKDRFDKSDAILFIGAAGIAVRAIAPFVQNKTKDPAILVMDEKGMFVISLLSGHLGGANDLAGAISNRTGAVPVITTATDVNGRFAVDVFAKKNRLQIENMQMAKEISVQVLDEQEIGFYSEFPVMGEIPEELIPFSKEHLFEGKYGICISLKKCPPPYKKTLYLIPKCITVGIGCRKGKTKAEIKAFLLSILEEHEIPVEALKEAASIDLKEQETGILELCEELKIPFYTYTAEELSLVEGEFAASGFVKTVTGVENVCERSALSHGGKLIQKKRAENGITIALSMEEWSVEFE